jgi:hypothetical protein
VTGAMTVRIAKTEVAGDNAVLHITLPNVSGWLCAHLSSRR